MVCSVPFGSTIVAVTLLAVLGPLLIIVTVAVIVWPGVPVTGAPIAIPRSALAPTMVGTVTVLAGLGSGVVLVPTAVLVMPMPLEAVTVALITSVKVWPLARLAVVAPTVPPTAAPVAVPWLEVLLIRVRPALRMSVRVTF